MALLINNDKQVIEDVEETGEMPAIPAGHSLVSDAVFASAVTALGTEEAVFAAFGVTDARPS